MHLHCGEITAIIGPNGAGKSTLLRALTGEMSCSGHMEFLDASGHLYAKPSLGYVPQSPHFELGMPMTVLDLFAATLSRFPVWLGTRMALKRRVSELLSQVGAEDLLHRSLGALSGGELQRILLALALEPCPNLLLLDEPSSGMDANGRRMFYQIVDQVRKQHDLAILLVSHDFGELLNLADRVVLLHQKILLDGKPADVFAHPLFQEIFGTLFSGGKT